MPLDVRVRFVRYKSGPPDLICAAELVFEGESPLTGLYLVGFGVWRGPDGAVHVTLPRCRLGCCAEEPNDSYILRGDDDAVARMAAFVAESFERQGPPPARRNTRPAASRPRFRWID